MISVKCQLEQKLVSNEQSAQLNEIFDSFHLSHDMRNLSSGFTSRSYTNRAVQPLKMAKRPEIADLGRRGIVLAV